MLGTRISVEQLRVTHRACAGSRSVCVIRACMRCLSLPCSEVYFDAPRLDQFKEVIQEQLVYAASVGDREAWKLNLAGAARYRC